MFRRFSLRCKRVTLKVTGFWLRLKVSVYKIRRFK